MAVRYLLSDALGSTRQELVGNKNGRNAFPGQTAVLIATTIIVVTRASPSQCN